jgi:ribonuclease R
MKDSNQLIEEFMLLANKKVAEFVGRRHNQTPKTFVYRIHDEPDMQKLHSFAGFIKQFGYKLKLSNEKEIAQSLNNLLAEVKGKPEQNVAEQLAVRSMAKAEYSTENIGHYGLAFDFYTHFTSPIRRYPDMLVHRLLDRYLANSSSVPQEPLELICKQNSDSEQQAAMAERASIKYKQVEFMQNRLGSIFDGVITGVSERGLYVEIAENRIEGMIAIRELDDDYYVYDEKNYCLIGQRKKQQYRLGDLIKIQIVRANLQKRQLDFVLTN